LTLEVVTPGMEALKRVTFGVHVPAMKKKEAVN